MRERYSLFAEGRKYTYATLWITAKNNNDTKYYSTRTNETRIGLVGMPRFDFEVQNVDLWRNRIWRCQTVLNSYMALYRKGTGSQCSIRVLGLGRQTHIWTCFKKLLSKRKVFDTKRTGSPSTLIEFLKAFSQRIESDDIQWYLATMVAQIFQESKFFYEVAAHCEHLFRSSIHPPKFQQSQAAYTMLNIH